MESRLLKTLKEGASSTTDKIVWARAVCRIASHFARQGEASRSLQAIADVRAAFDNRLEPEVACWLMLAEGILHFCQMHPNEAYDRARRALAIARALNFKDAIPICAAWMAHLEFNECKYEAMIANLDLALSVVEPGDHQAGGRVSLVIADAFHFCGDFASARPWYERCRLHATSEGDETTLSAMLHNVAAFRASNVRLSDAFGIVDVIEARRATVQAQSVSSFDGALGTVALSLLVPLLQGQLLVVEKKFLEALSIFQSIDRIRLHQRLVPILLIDTALCLSKLERRDDAVLALKESIALVESIPERDDFAYASARIAQVASVCGEQHIVDHWISSASVAIESHKKTQLWLLAELRKLGPFPANADIFRPK